MAALVLVGVPLGSALVAGLAPVGSRYGVPSMVAVRAVLGHRGAALVATVLFVTNFAWIAVNNTIAASVLVQWLAGAIDPRIGGGRAGPAGARRSPPGGPAAVRQADRWGGAGHDHRRDRDSPGRSSTAWRDLPAPEAAALTPLARSGRRRRLPGVVAADVRRLLALHANGAGPACGRCALGLTLTAWWLMPLGWRACEAVRRPPIQARCWPQWTPARRGGAGHAGHGDHQLRQHLPVVAGLAQRDAGGAAAGRGLDRGARRHRARRGCRRCGSTASPGS